MPKRLINWHFVNKQMWLSPSDNYITHVLVQRDTADHYRAIGDQVNMAPKGPLLRRTHELQGSYGDSSLKKNCLKYKASASIVGFKVFNQNFPLKK